MLVLFPVRACFAVVLLLMCLCLLVVSPSGNVFMSAVFDVLLLCAFCSVL